MTTVINNGKIEYFFGSCEPGGSNRDGVRLHLEILDCFENIQAQAVEQML